MISFLRTLPDPDEKGEDLNGDLNLHTERMDFRT